MAFVVLVVDCPQFGIPDLNDRTQLPTKVYESIQGAIDLLQGIEAGSYPAAVQVTTRNTDPGVTTSGSGSQQNTYNHK